MIQINLIRLLFILILSGNLWAITSTESNAISEENSVKISKIITKSLVTVGMNTVKAETYEKLTKYIIGNISKHVILKFCTGEQFVKSYEYVDALILNGTFERKVLRKLDDGLKTDLIWLASDLFVELIKQSIEEYSTMEYRYMKSTLWWIDIGYTDLKAALNPNKAMGAIDFVVGNGAVLVDMGVEINNTLKEIGETTWQIKFNDAMFNIDSYKYDTLKKYTKATSTVEKETIMNDFIALCKGEKVFSDIFSVGYRDVFNGKVNGLIINAQGDIESFDRDKFLPLLLMLKNEDFDQYKRYVNSYFPSDITNFLIINYYYFYDKRTVYSVKTNSVIFDYAIKILDYGFELKDFDAYYMGHLDNTIISDNKAYAVISKIVYKLYAGSPGSNYLYSGNTITRQKFASTLNNQVILDMYLSEADKENIKNSMQINNNLSYDMLVLNKLGIIQGNPLKIDFRQDDALSKLELLIITVRTIEYCEKNKLRIML